MPASEFFNNDPIKQIHVAKAIIEQYLGHLWNKRGDHMSPNKWAELEGKQLHYAVNSLLMYKQNIDMLPERYRAPAREELCLIKEEDLVTLQTEIQVEALSQLSHPSMGFK